MSGGAIFVLAACAMFPTLLIVAVVVKLREVQKAKRWPYTTGKVIVSEVQAIKKEAGAEGHNYGGTAIRNEPRVEYQYQVLGKTYRCGRITIGERTADFELESILARYPVGATVTVYYDPAKPGTAVLERDLFSGKLLAGGGCVLLFFIAGPLLAMLLYFNAVAWLTARLDDPHRAPFVAAAGGFGLLTLWFAIAFTRMVRQASRWPVTPGRIMSSGVEAFQDDSGEGPSQTHYRSRVLYTYEVNGHLYAGDRLRLGVVTSSNIPGMARRLAARYPVGSEVDVHYNPESPGESVLHPHSRWHYLLWITAAAMFALAWSVAVGWL
jgi:hypothetical protein